MPSNQRWPTPTSPGSMSSRRSRNSRRGRGFTLIELMVVVGIVAILVAIALPSYQDAVRKGKRGQAKSDVIEIAQRAERYRTVNNAYDAGAGFWASVPSADKRSPRGTAAADYLITEVEGADTFTLTATPQGGQAQDVPCGTLTINQAGAKAASGDASTTNENRCW